MLDSQIEKLYKKKREKQNKWERYYKLSQIDQPWPKWRLFYSRCPECNEKLHKITGYHLLKIYKCLNCDYEWADYNPPDLF